MFQGCTKMVLENVVIMGCCNKKLCSRSEYLAGGGGGAKKGNGKGRDHEGLGRVCLNHAIRYLRFYRAECVFASIELKKNWSIFFFLPTILSQRNGFLLSLVTDGKS